MTKQVLQQTVEQDVEPLLSGKSNPVPSRPVEEHLQPSLSANRSTTSPPDEQIADMWDAIGDLADSIAAVWAYLGGKHE